jgi:hypothetical protein
LLLGGESGMGKTTYLDWLLFNNLPVVEQERNRVPIIGIQAPVSQQTARPLLWRMVLECGHTFVTRDNEEILRYFAGALHPTMRRRIDRDR